MLSTIVVVLRTNAETKIGMNVGSGNALSAKGETTVIPRRASVHENRLADQEVGRRVQTGLATIIMTTMTRTTTVNDPITNYYNDVHEHVLRSCRMIHAQALLFSKILVNCKVVVVVAAVR